MQSDKKHCFVCCSMCSLDMPHGLCNNMGVCPFGHARAWKTPIMLLKLLSKDILNIVVENQKLALWFKPINIGFE